MLRAVGIRTPADLEQAGAVLAYAAVRDVHPGVSANLLYALHGALTGARWDRLPQATRNRLRREVEAVRRVDPGLGR